MTQPTSEDILYAPTPVEDQPPVQRDVPSKEELTASLNIDRSASKPTGRWSSYIYTLRKADLAKNPDDKWLKYVPNSRYQYVNRLLKKVEDTSKISQPDLDFISTFWMAPEHRKDMLAFFGSYVDKTLPKNFTVTPRPNSYSKAFRPVITTEGLRMVPSNPGIHNIDDDPKFIAYIKEMLGEKDYNRLSEGVHNLVTYTLEKYGADKDDETSNEIARITDDFEKRVVKPSIDVPKFQRSIEDIIEKFIGTSRVSKDEFGLPRMDPGLVSFHNLDKSVQSALLSLRRKLNEGHITTKDLVHYATVLQSFHAVNQTTYLMSLLDPWNVRDAKVPELMPIPTASFKIRSTHTMTTNASGNIAFAINPYALLEPQGIPMTRGSTFGVNSALTLIGSAADNNFMATDIGQNLPLDMYKSYRLVSAAVRLTPVGSTLTSSGFITLGLDLDSNQQLVTIGSPITDYAQYGSFQIIENLYYHHSEAFAAQKPVQVRWVPKDKSATEYKAVWANAAAVAPPNFMGTGKIVGYGQGLPTSQPCLKMDFVANFEAIVSPVNHDYMPTSFYKGSYHEYDRAMKYFTPTMAVSQGDLDAQDVIQRLTNDPTLQAPTTEIAPIALPPREDAPSLISQLLGSLKKGLGQVAEEIPWSALASSAITAATSLI